jgi:LexA-binding, inner membrane-associated putative hydrolase
MACALLAGTIADMDWLSKYFGPSVFLGWHGTYIHSILAAVLISGLFPAILAAAVLWGGLGIDVDVRMGKAISNDLRPMRNLAFRKLLVPLYLALLLPALLHIAMDACQSEGVALFWPFSTKRIGADWLPSIDPSILVILIGAVALPELLHLVSSEIGAKAKKPRGQTGAIIGLVLLVAYVVVRATLHSNALAMMKSRTFHGEAPRRTAAFPETLSLVTWHGIVETERSLNQVTVDVAGSGSFDPDTSMRIFKPEPSLELDAARNTGTATKFLAVARFPKATVEKTEKGYVVLLRDLRFAASGETQHEIAATIRLDDAGKVTSDELVWARDLHQ